MDRYLSFSESVGGDGWVAACMSGHVCVGVSFWV